MKSFFNLIHIFYLLQNRKTNKEFSHSCFRKGILSKIQSLLFNNFSINIR